VGARGAELRRREAHVIACLDGLEPIPALIEEDQVAQQLPELAAPNPTVRLDVRRFVGRLERRAIVDPRQQLGHRNSDLRERQETVAFRIQSAEEALADFPARYPPITPTRRGARRARGAG
jgi:hypothetical protein